jgi:hypothetical protein
MHPILASLAVCAALVGIALSAGAADLSRGELAAAHKINVTKCAKCHKLYHPNDYSVADWDRWMVKMAKKQLKEKQTSLLSRYFDLQRTSAVPEERKARK